MNSVFTGRTVMLAVVLFVCDSTAQVIRFVEAESCEIVRVDKQEPTIYDSILASGCKRVGNFWGERKGDELRWNIELYANEAGLKLGLRYSYNASHYARMRGKQTAKRRLTVLLDGSHVGDLPIDDTRNWEDFETAYLPLPSLGKGKHHIVIRSPEDRMTTDLDALTLFRGEPERVLTPAFRKSVVGKSKNGRFTLRMTAKAMIKATHEEVFQNFDRVYDFFTDYMGWEPDRPVINLHIYEDRLSKGTYENQFGLYFQASNFNWDRGNWIHEMNHIFDNGLFPSWTGHPMIRVNDTFITGPKCFPELWKGPESDPEWSRRLALGQKVLADSNYHTDDPHEILYALYAKYGETILRKFYKECREAKARGEIKLVRGHGLTTPEYTRLMSRAAGEDIKPLFQQWRGYDKEK